MRRLVIITLILVLAPAAQGAFATSADDILHQLVCSTNDMTAEVLMRQYVTAKSVEIYSVQSVLEQQRNIKDIRPTITYLAKPADSNDPINPRFIEKGGLLREAFAFLNANNPLITRFNSRNGNGDKAYSPYPYGLPYLWAGKNIKGDQLRVVFIPEYSGESKEYKFGRAYLEGFDCSGYVSHIYKTLTGRKDFIPGISQMLSRRHQHVSVSGSPRYFYESLQIGDLFVCSDREGGSSNHVLMYIGTLSDYGYTAELVPSLARYLTYPLVIHCSSNNFQRAWFSRYIALNQIAKRKNVRDVWPPCGGVMVSLIGVPYAAATKVEPLYNNSRDVYSFDLEGYELTIYPLYEKKEYAVYRP